MPYSVSFFLAFLGLISYALYQLPREPPLVKWWETLILSILAVSIAIGFGYGEFIGQVDDTITNNFKFYDLITNDWPLFYSKQDAYLCYYIGYYLPVGAFGKIAGIHYAHWADLLWVSTGLTLIFSWIFQLQTSAHKWFILLFMILFADGMHVFYELLRTIHLDTRHLVNWGVVLDNNSPFPYFLHASGPLNKSVQWAPQHTIAVGITILWILKSYLSEKTTFYSLIAVMICAAGCIFWSPLSAIGLVPFVGFLLWSRRSLVFNLMFIALAGGLLICILPELLYLSSNSAIGNKTTNYFIWQANTATWPFWYALYLFVFFGVWVILIYNRINQKELQFVGVAVAVVSLAALYRMGIWNDWNIRISTSSIFVFGYFAGCALFNNFKLNRKTVVYFVFFLLCIRRPINEFLDVTRYPTPKNTIEKPFISGATNTIECLANRYSVQEANQYLMRKNTFFEIHLMKTRK